MSEDGEGPKPEWSEALENIIVKEGEQCEALFWLHNKAFLWSSRRNDLIQIPSIVLSTVTGFLSATSNLVPQLALGAISVFVGVLNTVNSYYKFSSRGESHRIISTLYHKTYKQIEVELSLPIAQRTPAEDFLKSLRTTMAQVSETAPPIPESIIAQFQIKFKNTSTSVPIIANGLDRIRVEGRRVTTSTPIQPGLVSVEDAPVAAPPKVHVSLRL
jgi:hypothetical protein